MGQKPKRNVGPSVTEIAERLNVSMVRLHYGARKWTTREVTELEISLGLKLGSLAKLLTDEDSQRGPDESIY